MQFIDLKYQQQLIIEDINQRIQNVLDHGSYIMGPEVRELEDQLAAYVDVKHAISCSSGTDALLLSLMAKGTGPGHAIFTTPFTFIATAEVISLLGATPVFVDVDQQAYNIDPQQLEIEIEKAATENNLKPFGIISVDLFGLPADYNNVTDIADKYGIFIIEDAAQSFGAEYNGRKTCALTDIACTSFFPAKPLGCYGDGGMCFTNNDELADIIKSLRLHGKGTHKYDNARIGVNGRLDTLQAAILLSKFRIFPEEIEKRQHAADRYTRQLKQAEHITPPLVPEGYKSAWAQYSILAENTLHREAIQNALKEAGIPTAVYYPKPLHIQTAFKSLGYSPGDFPVSESCSERIFSIPMHPYLKKEDQLKVTDIINKVTA